MHFDHSVSIYLLTVSSSLIKMINICEQVYNIFEIISLDNWSKIYFIESEKEILYKMLC
jgi:hypothetical protein